MPAIRYYTVTQEREIKVSATSLIEAAQFADAVFKEQTTTVPANLLTEIRERDLVVREDY